MRDQEDLPNGGHAAESSGFADGAGSETAPSGGVFRSHAGFGLALGGGSLRGLAHVGVLDGLASHGLAPSSVVGTSAGAIAASLFAFGMSPADMGEAFEDVSWRKISRLRPRVPIGVLTNEGLGGVLVELIGDVKIEDSLIPLRIVTADIRTGERVVLDRGSVATAVRASCCLPGVFMPIAVEDRLLVDGSLVENVPVRAAQELHDGVVAAVSLGFDVPFDDPDDMLEVLVNALEIAVIAPSRRDLRRADVRIEPDVSGFNKLLARERTAIVGAGREAALRAVPHLRRALRGR